MDSPFRDILRRVGIIGSNSPSPVRDSHDDGTALKSQSPDLEDGDRIPSRSHSPNSDRLTDNASDNDGSLERKMRFSGDCGVGVCVREAFIMDNDDEDDYKSAKEESSSSNVDEDSMSGEFCLVFGLIFQHFLRCWHVADLFIIQMMPTFLLWLLCW